MWIVPIRANSDNLTSVVELNVLLYLLHLDRISVLLYTSY